MEMRNEQQPFSRVQRSSSQSTPLAFLTTPFGFDGSKIRIGAVKLQSWPLGHSIESEMPFWTQANQLGNALPTSTRIKST